MVIRQAVMDDLGQISEIYAQARRFMREQGNFKQWINGYPSSEQIQTDILSGNCYVCVLQTELIGVFCYFPGPDPTYTNIYEGQWSNQEPYGVTHRIAVKIHRQGVAEACYRFALQRCRVLRIDTHRDNIPMQRSLAKNGFRQCGIIFLENGDPRIAFDKTVP